MRAAPRPEAVAEPQEVGLIDGSQHLGHRPLDNLVLQGGDAGGCHLVSGYTCGVPVGASTARCGPFDATPGDWPPGPAHTHPPSPDPPRDWPRAAAPGTLSRARRRRRGAAVP